MSSEKSLTRILNNVFMKVLEKKVLIIQILRNFLNVKENKKYCFTVGDRKECDRQILKIHFHVSHVAEVQRLFKDIRFKPITSWLWNNLQINKFSARFFCLPNLKTFHLLINYDISGVKVYSELEWDSLKVWRMY